MTDSVVSPQLYRVPSGRLFVRAALGERRHDDWRRERTPMPHAAMLLGVIDVPRALRWERLYACRLNDSLWMDTTNPRDLRGTYAERGSAHLAASGLGDVMRQLHFALPALPDACEVFVRRTMLPHEREDRCWAYVAGALATRPAQMPTDGIYAFDTDGIKLVEANAFVGDVPDGILRACRWGPEGRFGLSSSMEPDAFHAWIPGERERHQQRDPLFAAFQTRMDERCGPLQMYYTQDDADRRQAAGAVVMRDLLLAEHGASDASAGEQATTEPVASPLPESQAPTKASRRTR